MNAFILLFKQIVAIPKTIADAARQRQRQINLDAHEAERLDRICHPSKYRGK